jgi:4-amino-4-deoxy-L-arabinose transferase-like glycosyltransferase
MMPAVAGMTGAGVEALRRAWRRGSHAALLVPTAVAVTGLLELHILSDLSVHWAEATYGRLGPLICAVALVAALLLVAARIDVAYRRMARTAAVAALAIGCLGPAAWTSSVLRDAGALNTPVAGPPLDRYAAIRTAEERAARQIGLPASAVDTVSSPGGAETASLIAFASANLHGERWALATEVGIQSSDIMIRSDLAVAALGGIQGDDPIVSSSALAKMVAAHEVRFVLLKQPPAPGPTVRDDAAWVEAHCVTVPASLWQPPAGFGVRPGDTLQDCSPGTAPVMASSAAFPA